jgi:hypothetical protein
MLYLGKPTQKWFDLSEEEREVTLAKVVKSLHDVGGKGLVAADCSWSSGQWHFFGVQEFPDLESLQKHVADCHEIGWPQYIEETDFVGSPMPE